MNDIDRWANAEGPAPDRLRPILVELRNQAPLTQARRLALIEGSFAALAAAQGLPFTEDDDDLLPCAPTPPAPGWAAPAQAPIADGAPTVRRPAVGERVVTRGAGPPASVMVVNTAPPPPPLPVVVKAPAALLSTATAPDRTAAQWAALGRLPFISPQDAPRPAARTEKIPVFPAKGYGETVPLGDGENRLSQVVRALLPFVPAEAAPPVMGIARYACLRAELEMAPSAGNEIWSRYGVPEIADRRQLVSHWERVIAGNAELGAWVEGAKAWWKARLQGG